MNDPGKAARDAMNHARHSMDRTLEAGRIAREKAWKKQQDAFQKRLSDQSLKRSRSSPAAAGSVFGGPSGLKKPQQRSTSPPAPREPQPTSAQRFESRGEVGEQRHDRKRYRPRPERSVMGGFFGFLAALFKIMLILLVIGFVIAVLSRRH